MVYNVLHLHNLLLHMDRKIDGIFQSIGTTMYTNIILLLCYYCYYCCYYCYTSYYYNTATTNTATTIINTTTTSINTTTSTTKLYYIHVAAALFRVGRIINAAVTARCCM